MKNSRIMQNVWLTIFCIISACAYLFFSPTLSPLYTIEACDSSVFKLMGRVIIHGKLPYVDIFDHKGPMLYSL